MSFIAGVERCRRDFNLGIGITACCLAANAGEMLPRGAAELAYVPNPSLWRTPPIRPRGFQFEIQLSSLGKSYEAERVRQSIRGHNLGEYESALSKMMAAECLKVIEAFLHRQYIAGANHPWASMSGHFPWQHCAAEFGFDQIGSEIGENINNYQWHIALTRGAARQYTRPWFIGFSDPGSDPGWRRRQAQTG